MAADAIDLDEVDPPTRIELGNRIVISFGRRLPCIQTIVVEIPRTGVRRTRRVPGAITRSCDRQVLRHRLFRNTAENMNAEFEPQRMDVIGQRLETGAPRSRREPADPRGGGT